MNCKDRGGVQRVGMLRNVIMVMGSMTKSKGVTMEVNIAGEMKMKIIEREEV